MRIQEKKESGQGNEKQRIAALEAELKREQERFNVIFQNTSVSIWDYNFAEKQIIQPSRSRELHGFGTVVENVPDSLIESGYVHPDSAKAFREMYDKLLAGEMHAEGIFRVQTADRRGYWYEHIRYSTLLDTRGNPYAAVGMSTDVTERMENKKAMERWKELLSGTLGHNGAVIEFDLYRDVFTGTENTVGFEAAGLAGMKLDTFIAEYTRKHVYVADMEKVRKRLQRARLLADYTDGKREFEMEYRLQYAGKIYWIRLSAKIIRDQNEDTVRLFILHTDITKQKEKELELQRRADSDVLTGLLNYRAFTEQGQDIFVQLPGHAHALMLIDLDAFKDINEAYGHMVGDRMLTHAGQCITGLLAEFNDNAVSGRVGGDEFGVLFYNSSRARVEEYAKALLEKLSQPVMDGISLSASAGIAFSPSDGKDFDELYMAADRAVYYVKTHGKASCCFYESIWHEQKGTLLRRQQFLSDTISGGMMGSYLEEGFPFYFIDDRMLRWLGYDGENDFIRDIGGLLENCRHPQDRGYVAKMIRQQLLHNEKFEVDYRMRKKDGSYIWVHEIGECMSAPDGRRAITSVCHDITMEREHANLIQRLVDDAKGGIALYQVEEDWRIRLLYASENLGMLADYSDREYQELCRKDALDLVYETDRSAVLETIKKAITEDVVSSASYRVPNRRGGYTWLTGTFSRFGEEQGRPVLRAVYMPLPLQYELQLQTLNADSIGVYVVDQHTRELYYANDASFRMYNVPACDITGKKCYEVYYRQGRMCDNCWLHRAQEEQQEIYLPIDEEKTISVQVQKRRWNEKDIVIVYSRDVSEQVLAQKKREELINRIPGGICLYRYDGKNLEPVVISDAFVRLTGVDREQLLQMKGLEKKIIHPDDLPGLLRYLKECVIQPGENYSYQFRIWSREKQSYIWIEFHANTVRQKEELLFYVACSDITNANRVQERLENSRQALNVMIQYGNLCMWSYDLDTRRLIQEYTDYQAYGYETVIEDVPESCIAGKDVHPEDAEAVRALYRRILDGEEQSECTVRIYDRHAGKYLWMNLFLVRRKDLQNGCRRATGFSIVVDREVNSIRRLEQAQGELETTLKEMALVQEQLRRSREVMEARLNLERKKLQGNDKDLLFYYIANVSKGIITEFKDAYMETPVIQSGVSMDEFTHEGRQRLAYEKDREWLAQVHQRERLLSNYHEGMIQEEYKTQIVLREGCMIWTSHRMQLLQEPETGDILLYEYVYNINADQIIEAMLKMEVSYGYEVIGNLFVRDDQFTYLEITGQSGPPELKDIKFTDYIREYAGDYLYPEDRQQYIDHYMGLSGIAAEPGRVHSEVLYRTFAADGSIRYHKDDNYFYDKEKGIFLLTRREYTDIVRSEEKEKQRLADALEKAEEAGRAKNDFLARMSHDMRTPMNAIIGLTALTIDAAEDPLEVRANMAKMNSASEFLLGLVNDILDMAKIEDRSLSLNMELYRYSDFLTNVRTIFLPQCEAKGIRLFLGDGAINPVIRCDRVRLNQIFYNIFSNAVKYTMPGGTIEFRTRNVRIDGGRLCADYIIKDSGIGMSEEFQKHMFEPFTRENTAITAELQGSGLGLSITRQLVELMGGSIQVISRKDEGTEVILHLEFECVDEDAKEEKTVQAAQDGRAVLRGKVVLLAEDHPLNAEIASKLLEKQQMTVLHAENGRVAVEMFGASAVNSIDAVLMDIRMPEMDGLEAAAVIRALKRPDAGVVPIIAMSANAYPEDVQKSLDAGMDAHLSKPIDTAALFGTLEEKLAKR